MKFARIGQLAAFTAPKWASSLPRPPTSTLKVCHELMQAAPLKIRILSRVFIFFFFQAAVLPTPLHEWRLGELKHLAPPSQFALGIKRDDLTGAELSGNKVRLQPRPSFIFFPLSFPTFFPFG